MIAHEPHTIQGTGLRLDRFLLNTYPWLDRTTVLELISSGAVTRNSARLSKGTKLSDGDTLDCRNIPDPEDLNLRPNPDLPLTILYEDDSLLAFDKPAGQPTHPLRYSETDTLANAMIARYPDLADIGGVRLFPALLHRIDTQTSGLVLAAKTPAAYAALRSQFRRFTVEKHYTALVHGIVKGAGRLDAPLTHQTRSPCKMTVVHQLDKVPENHRFDAMTAWTPIETGKEMSQLDVTIFTGVTHQIRCHLADAGHPVVGDSIYSSPNLPSAFSLQSSASPPRHWLHASRILLSHPATGEPLEISCPLPADWPATDR
jgi:23S rRNA pseudouridine1911/1915/1917 synthase